MSEKDALNHEIEMIKTWGRKDLGTGMLRNMTDGGECGNKTIRTDETKAKIRIAKAYTSPETRLKMSLAHMGQKLSPERRKNLLLVNTGRKCTQETKAKIRLASIGKKMSHESRLKMSLANLGKKATNQAKANMSLAQFARWKKHPEGKC